MLVSAKIHAPCRRATTASPCITSTPVTPRSVPPSIKQTGKRHRAERFVEKCTSRISTFTSASPGTPPRLWARCLTTSDQMFYYRAIERVFSARILVDWPGRPHAVLRGNKKPMDASSFRVPGAILWKAASFGCGTNIFEGTLIIT